MQRLGCLLKVLDLADKEAQWMELRQKIGAKFTYVALKASVEKHPDDERDKRWKIVINQELEIDPSVRP